jgi:hypothetical protein
LCGGCASGADCPDLLGCTADATCGACATDSDCRTGEGCSEGVCLATTISEVRITVDPADYRTLRADRYNEDLNVPCSVAADGVSYAGATTLAIHGGSSRDLPKLSFAVETASDEHPGYAEKMVLRAEYNDASALRNILGLELFRRSTDLPTPRTRTCVSRRTRSRLVTVALSALKASPGVPAAACTSPRPFSSALTASSVARRVAPSGEVTTTMILVKRMVERSGAVHVSFTLVELQPVNEARVNAAKAAFA